MDIESREILEISSAVENISNVQKKRKKVRHRLREIEFLSDKANILFFFTGLT